LRSADWGEGYHLYLENVPVDLSTLPTKPTERDFALIIAQLLEQESGFAGFETDFVMWTVPCGSDVYAPSEVYMWVSWVSSDSQPQWSLDGTVSLWPQRNEAEISIASGETLLAEYTTGPDLDLNGLRWHVDDVLRLAEEQGGQEYRNVVQNQCEIKLRLSSFRPIWLTEYIPSEDAEYFCMTLDYQTGIYTTTITSDTHGCKW